ncbi:ThuA domain-containing protein [Hufsiella ginkgonis]|nr:ThuA domain-containing protein [Hufsiella ginkgonis]
MLPVVTAQPKVKPRFRALAVAETGGGHALFDAVAKTWLNKLAADSNFTIDYLADTKQINEKFLKKYQLFIQLDYPPYPWKAPAQKAFESYIEKGKGGWIGFHHPTLLGVFDGYPMWQWYSRFMGDIQFKRHIPGGTSATLNVEDPAHPVMKGLPASFLTKDEWYIYDKSPRPNVHVIASIDEATYDPDKAVKMGDHPVIWTNGHVKARNLYIAMGHFPELLEDESFTRLFRNAIFWATERR